MKELCSLHYMQYYCCGYPNHCCTVCNTNLYSDAVYEIPISHNLCEIYLGCSAIEKVKPYPPVPLFIYTALAACTCTVSPYSKTGCLYIKTVCIHSTGHPYMKNGQASGVVTLLYNTIHPITLQTPFLLDPA